MAFEAHPQLLTPADDSVLWRYMDFAKFVYLLQTKALWFSRQDQFEDPLEGTYTDAELKHLHSLPADPVSPDGSGVADSYLRGPKLMRGTLFVNCWRAGSNESLAMWDIYGKGSGMVAVKTTVGLLKRAAEAHPQRVFVTAVNYLDWSHARWDNNLLVMCARKDKSYEHESEVRAMIWGLSPVSQAPSLREQTWESALGRFMEGLPVGIQIPFDPQLFLTEIVVGPREPGWVADLVRNVTSTYGVSVPVSVSDRLTPRR